MSIFFDDLNFNLFNEAPDDMGSADADTSFNPDAEEPTEGDGTAGSDPAGDATEDMGSADADTSFNPDEGEGDNDSGDDFGDDAGGGDMGSSDGMSGDSGDGQVKVAVNDEEIYKKEKLLEYYRNLMNQIEDVIQSVKLISYNTMNTDHRFIKLICKNLESDYKNLIEVMKNRFNKYDYAKLLTIYTYIKINVSSYIDLIKKFMEDSE